jgi:DNA invertase Pin-like site-specific DNA recombinase
MQLDSLKEFGCIKSFSDIGTGSNTTREGLKSCLEYMREGDTLVVWKADRLGRSTLELLKLVGVLQERKINFKSITENLFDTTSPNGKLILGIFALLAEHERDRIRERIMPGLAVARAKGKLGGRLPLLSEAKRKIALDALNKENSVASVAKALGVSVMTIYRLLRRERDKELKVKDFRK